MIDEILIGTVVYGMFCREKMYQFFAMSGAVLTCRIGNTYEKYPSDANPESHDANPESHSNQVPRKALHVDPVVLENSSDLKAISNNEKRESFVFQPNN